MTGLQQNILIDCTDQIADAVLDGKSYYHIVVLIERLKVSHSVFNVYTPGAETISLEDTPMS